MKTGYIPWASITVQGADGDVPEDFLREFERRFCNHFESVEVKRPWLPRSAVMLMLRKSSLSVGLKRISADSDEWKLVVCAVSPFALDWLRGRRMNPQSVDLRGACREIHAILTGMSSVSRLYWYARGSRKNTAAVWTPDELPWNDPASA